MEGKRMRTSTCLLASLLVIGTSGLSCATEYPTGSTYALAYSSGRHFVTIGHTLHLIYADGPTVEEMKIWDLESRDGLHWTRQPLPAEPATYPVTHAWDDHGQLRVITASHGRRALTVLTPSTATTLLRWPEAGAVEAPEGSEQAMVFRSQIGNNKMRLWVRWSDGTINRLTTDAEEAGTGAGTSGQIHRVGQDWLVIWGANGIYASQYRAGRWTTERIEEQFNGVHDISAVVLGQTLWVAYLSGPYGDIMVRSWTAKDGWTPSVAAARTEVHSVNLWTDGTHLYLARILPAPRRLSVVRRDGETWHQIGLDIPIGTQGGYLWPCGTQFQGRTILAWAEEREEGRAHLCVQQIDESAHP